MRAMSKCPRVLYAKPSIKRFIIPLQKYFFILASFFSCKSVKIHPALSVHQKIASASACE